MEPEQETPEHNTSNNYYDYSSKYDYNSEGEDHKGELWLEEVDPKFSFEEESEQEMMEPKAPDQVQASLTTQSKPWIHSNDDKEDYKPQIITFSGYRQNPKAYLRWEEDIEAWFQSCQIVEEEKLTFNCHRYISRTSLRVVGTRRRQTDILQ